ncbi:Major facilitator superfamily [Lasiodiplodia theobromae]|uniref:Efflux pump rdc3 n=1 Tax=Lasiodiplodia theobromae TaxID=45133 RepID=A0A5N5DNC2_9PEZI|nr:MFS transporter [Lasiodiplodia theobromae]KAB2578831.1 Efflux pump rdc3 [Lasiodiplodia theobromae]KAF4535388.1 MFS transporter [Lasiodiplodia theobromae]KAF9638665.1 Major facilitator superfamily [Lasiodiplodia theobromae]
MSSPAPHNRLPSRDADNGIVAHTAHSHSPHLHLPHAPSRQVEIDARDVQDQLDIEDMDHKSGCSTPADGSDGGSIERRIISFEKNDPEDPTQWPWRKKALPLISMIACVMNSTISSSLAAGASKQISSHFHVTNQAQLVLPTSIFLVGYVVGPLIFGPMSEWYGRKHIMIVAFAMFTIFSMACALADTFAALVVFRLLVGIPGSCAISVTGGIIADIYNEPTSRGRAMALFMATTTFGPLIGPVASGFISVISWRWAFWLGLIIAGVAWVPLLATPETYAPVILKQRAKRLRKETGDANIFAPIELEPRDLRHVATVVLTRPIRMMLFEWIVLFSCLYLAFVYAVFYMFFQAYPLMYGGTYGFNAGEVGLAFLPIGLGALIAASMYLWYDAFLARARARKAAWTRSEEARRLPLACVAGPFIVVSFFWVGWTARPEVHWAVPVFAGVPFGVGYLLCFMAILNYLVDAYEIFAASAMAAAGTSRSIFGAVLPFAARPMYERLGIDWACSLLGFVMLGLCAIPFVFWRFGDEIRANSAFCNELKQRRKQQEQEDGLDEELPEAGREDEEKRVGS